MPALFVCISIMACSLGYYAMLAANLVPSFFFSNAPPGAVANSGDEDGGCVCMPGEMPLGGDGKCYHWCSSNNRCGLSREYRYQQEGDFLRPMDCRPKPKRHHPKPVHIEPSGTFCQSIKEDPPQCRVDNDHIDILIGMPTVKRPEVGFAYLQETVSGFLKLPRQSRLVFHPRVFEFKHGQDGEFTPDSDILAGLSPEEVSDERLKIEHVRTTDVSTFWSDEDAPRGIWRQVKTNERQHNEDLLMMMRHLEQQCTVLHEQQGEQSSSESCADSALVMLTEDDFAPCEHFFPAMNELLFSKCVRRKDVLGLRISSGGSGVIIPCRDLNFVADRFEKAIDQGPADYLLSFVMNFQPDFDQHTLSHRGGRPFLVYYQSLLKHIGFKRSSGENYVYKPETVPGCGDSLTSMGVIEEEFWTGSCRGVDSNEVWELVQPCGNTGSLASPWWYQRSDDDKHSWYFKWNADDEMWRCLASNERGFYQLSSPLFAQQYLDNFLP